MDKKRDYNLSDVEKLRGSRHYVNHFARDQALNLRAMFRDQLYVNTFGAYNGQQAVQHVKAGLKAIYCSGWQVAAAASSNQQVYPDQSLYPVDSVPDVVRSINNAFKRQDQIEYLENGRGFKYAPIIADAEAGFGGALNAYELARNLIDAGAAGVHFEDQLASEKKCGHLGGKVLVPVSTAVRNLNAARLASDVMGTSTVIIARTDAESAKLLSSDVDDFDKRFITGDRTPEGFYKIKDGVGLDYGCERGQAYAEYADLVWCETSKPCLKEAKRFADAVKGAVPDAMLAYNCSPSFNWGKAIPSEEELRNFQMELGKMGFVFQFITLGGFHATNYATFQFALEYKSDGMLAFSRLQQKEIASESLGFTTSKHQREVGVGYFDKISEMVGSGSTTALKGSTEEEQF